MGLCLPMYCNSFWWFCTSWRSFFFYRHVYLSTGTPPERKVLWVTMKSTIVPGYFRQISRQWWKSWKNEELVKKKYPFHLPIRRQHSDIRWNYKFKLQKCAACQDLPTLQFWSKSINISHVNLLLRNHWANCNQTLVEWSLDGPLPKSCPLIPTSNQDGHQAKNRKKGEWHFNCPLLL